MTRAPKLKNLLTERTGRSHNPHLWPFVVIGTIAAGLVLTLIAAILISVNATGSELVIPAQEMITNQQAEPDTGHEGDVARSNEPHEPADQEAPTEPTPIPTASPEEPDANHASEPDESRPGDGASPAPPSTTVSSPVENEPDANDPGAEDPEPVIAVDEEDFPEGSALPDSGAVYPAPPARPATFEFDLPVEPTGLQPPALEPAPLVVYPPVVPTPVPLPTPEPLELGPLDGPPAGLTSNAFGCKSRCITRAVLSRNLHDADVDFEVETNVATTNAIWVLPAGPPVVNGVPAHIGKPPRAVNQQAGGSWSGTLSGLAHDTTYRVVLTAADNQGNVAVATTLLTTVSEPVDDLVAPGSPCVFECITDGVVTPGPTFDRAQIRVETTDTVTIDIAISQSEPGTIAGSPFLTNEVVITGLTKDGNTYNANIFDLEADTTYYVVVKATDAEGIRQHATGSFVSMVEPPPPPPPSFAVVAWVDRFHIHQDGDVVGKGEISFEYGIRYPNEAGIDHVWRLPFQKLDEGETIAAGGFRSLHVEAGEHLPQVIVNARESDAVANRCPSEVGGNLQLESTDTLCPNETLTAAVLHSVTVDWILNLPTCETWNVAGGNPNDRCFTLRSFGVEDDFVDFGALIVFRVFEV